MQEQRLKALGEPCRYRLMLLMQQRSYCVAALAHASGMSESSVSQHLKVLREAGLVTGVKRGFYTHYTINREALGEVISALSMLAEKKPIPCDRPYYGCSEAEYVRCKAYVPPEERQDNKEN